MSPELLAGKPYNEGGCVRLWVGALGDGVERGALDGMLPGDIKTTVVDNKGDRPCLCLAPGGAVRATNRLTLELERRLVSNRALVKGSELKSVSNVCLFQIQPVHPYTQVRAEAHRRVLAWDVHSSRPSPLNDNPPS